MAASVSLPSTNDSHSYPPPAAPGLGYPLNLQYTSPNFVNGYPPPDQQGGYSNNRLPPRPGYGQDPYTSDHYYAYRGQPYQGPLPQLTQAAPRQRASIACRYCRKRKIRCSGHQSTPGGKCQNCARMNQECIFQPVSSSNSTAFIPVSAVPGGIPPGTQLFGAYGQPLAPSSVAAPHPQGSYQQHPPSAPPPENYRPPARQQGMNSSQKTQQVIPSVMSLSYLVG